MSQKEEGMRLFLITAYLFPKVMLCALVIIISFYTENFIDNYFDVLTIQALKLYSKIAYMLWKFFHKILRNRLHDR